LLSAAHDGGVRLWAAPHAQCLVSYHGHSHPVFHVSFSSHNAQFLTSCYDGAVRIFSTERRSPLRVLAGHTADVNVGIFHPNGAYVLSASEDATLRLWDVSTAGCIRLFHGHHRAVKCAAISPDGAIAASASEDRTVRIWHLASGKMLCSLPLGSKPIRPRAICFSSNGKLLACIGEYTVGIWEVRDLTRGEDIPPPALSFKSVVPLMGASFLPNQSVLILACTELTSQSS
jgi:transcription initiation factor TFIID subunit 5